MMNYFKSNNIDFLIEGIPLCFMRGFKKNCSETYRMSVPSVKYEGGGVSKHKDLHSFIHSSLKTKSSVCKKCKLDDQCVGVWKEYAEIHGLSELVPIKNG